MNNADDQRCELGIDCPPEAPRQGGLMPGVLEGSGLILIDFEDPLTLFGALTWRPKSSPEKEALFIARKPLIQSRLEALLGAGTIRGGVANPTGPHLRIIR